MSTEVPRKVNRDIETPTAQQIAANVFAGSDEEKAKIEGRKHISGRTAAIALSLLTAAGVGAGAAAAEYASSHSSTPEAKPTDHAAPAPTNGGDVLPTATATPSGIDLPPTASPSYSASSIEGLSSAAPTTTSETQSAIDPETITVAAEQIPAGLSDQAFAEAYVKRESEQMMAGATPSAYTNRDMHITPKVYAENIVGPIIEKYAEAEYGPDYNIHPSLAQDVETTKENVANNLDNYLATFDGSLNPNNKEPYFATAELRKVLSSKQNSDGGRTIQMATIVKNNSDMNRARTENGKTVNYEIWTITTRVVNGVEYTTESVDYPDPSNGTN